MKIIWNFTGSVATIKYNEIKEKFKDHQVFVLYTTSATHFNHFKPISTLNEFLFYFNSADPFWIPIDEQLEWLWKGKNDLVIHIELRKWADKNVIIPCSANTLAKLTNGISDSLLLSVCRAWDYSKPIIVCPCMNTMMYNHPITNEQLMIFKSWGGIILYPIEKLLACGDYGMGALPSIESIYSFVVD